MLCFCLWASSWKLPTPLKATSRNLQVAVFFCSGLSCHCYDQSIGVVNSEVLLCNFLLLVLPKPSQANYCMRWYLVAHDVVSCVELLMLTPFPFSLHMLCTAAAMLQYPTLALPVPCFGLLLQAATCQATACTELFHRAPTSS